MPILDAVKERVEPVLGTVKEGLARGAVGVARADLTADGALAGLLDGLRGWLAPRLAAAKRRLAPKVDAARERLAPVAAATKERLAPVVEPLTPVLDRVREAASGFGEIAVGSVPDAELVRDPVGELRAYFDVQDTAVIEPLPARRAIEAPEEELEVPPRESWALSTLDEEPAPQPVLLRSRPRERATLV